MWYLETKYSDDYFLSNKNLRNNQNYIIDKSIKNNMIFEYLFIYKKLIFPLNIFSKIIVIVIKEFILDKLKIKNKYLFISFIHFLLFILFVLLIPIITLLDSFFVYFCILIFIYLQLFISKKFFNYFRVFVLTLWFRKGNTTYKRSYEEKLIRHIYLTKDDYLKKLISYSFLSISFFTFVLFFLIKLY